MGKDLTPLRLATPDGLTCHRAAFKAMPFASIDGSAGPERIRFGPSRHVERMCVTAIGDVVAKVVGTVAAAENDLSLPHRSWGLTIGLSLLVPAMILAQDPLKQRGILGREVMLSILLHITGTSASYDDSYGSSDVPPAPFPLPASPIVVQGFESSVLGSGWATGSTGIRWTRNSGGTPSGGTGPSSAKSGSYYMYIETSSPRVSGDTFDLTYTCADATHYVSRVCPHPHAAPCPSCSPA